MSSTGYDGDINGRNSELILNENIDTQEFYNRYWEKAIEELNLEFLSQIEYGLEFGIEELPMVIKELNEVLKWSDNNLEQTDNNLIRLRIELLFEKLPEAFVDLNNIVYIG